MSCSTSVNNLKYLNQSLLLLKLPQLRMTGLTVTALLAISIFKKDLTTAHILGTSSTLMAPISTIGVICEALLEQNDETITKLIAKPGFMPKVQGVGKKYLCFSIKIRCMCAIPDSQINRSFFLTRIP